MSLPICVQLPDIPDSLSITLPGGVSKGLDLSALYQKIRAVEPRSWASLFRTCAT